MSSCGRKWLGVFMMITPTFWMVVGCTPQAPATFVPSDIILEDDFPVNHREQIDEALRDYFGTPANPRMRLPDQNSDNDDPELIDAVDPSVLKLGATVYMQRCVQCHGVTGDGLGQAAQYLNPKPRDYRRGLF